MRFITQMAMSRAAGEFDMNAEEFLSDYKDHGNRKGYKVNEVLKGNPVVRLYCDFDYPTEGSSEPTQKQKDAYYETLREVMMKIVPDQEVAYAHRNGWKVKKNKQGVVTYEGWVLSYRAYVKGLKMYVSDIPQYIRMKLQGNIPEGLDLSVYKVTGHGQLLGTVGAHKFDYDTRILTPLTHQDDPLAFVCQHFYGNEELVTLPDTVTPPPAYSVIDKSAKKITRKSLDHGKYEIRSMISSELGYQQIFEQSVKSLSWSSVVPILQSMGFAQLQFVSVGECGFNFSADRSLDCPVCRKRKHESNHWFIMWLMMDIFVVKNYSNMCHIQIVNWENNAYIKKILRLAKCDAPYAEIFAKIFENRMYWTSSNRYVFYENHRWQEMQKSRVIGTLKGMIHSILDKLITCLNLKQSDINRDTTTPERDHNRESTKVRRELAAVNDALRFSQLTRSLCNIEKLIQVQMINPQFENQLDKNPHLLGLNNGVIDLQTCTYRHGMPSDYISKSVGYDFIHPESTDYDLHIMEDVEKYISRIYPVEEEREFIQRYVGYCLLGNHTEKIFCICIDEREGYNGKTQAGKMWTAALGPDYMKDTGNNAIIYQSDFQESMNSHSRGMMAYEGKRLVVIEETTKHKRLNNSLLKMLHGGSTTFSGSNCGAKEEKSFEWICKMIINTNDGQMAEFDWHDAALCSRMVVIRHRSKFCLDVAEYERHQHKPYTFMAEDRIEDIKSKWRPYILLWMLKGLQRYHEVGFKNKPASFTEFKQSLVGQQDVVTPWVLEVTEKLDDIESSDSKMRFITQRQLYDLFKQSHPEERVKKTALGIKLFGDRVSKALGTTPNMEPVQFRHEGQKICKKSCYIGVALKTDF